jgi:hypothetical protein
VTEPGDLGDDGGAYDIPRPQTAPTLRYKLLTIDELLSMKRNPWLVCKAFRLGDLAAFFGDPGCGKTFVVLDMVFAVASGLEWRVHKTRKGGVVYLAGEGAGGLGRRLLAWGIERGVDVRALDVRILPHAIPFMNDVEFRALLDSLEELPEKPTVIVVDTLARYMLFGDENSARDMGVFVDRCTKLRDATGATVIIVHHKRKGAAFERGSSALRGAADVMIEVRKESGLITVVGDKSKDDEPLEPHYFRFKSVYLGQDEDGEPATSLVLVECQAPEHASTEAEAAAPDAQAAEPAEPPVDHGATIRHALATLFVGKASGSALREATASKLPRSTYYDVLSSELEAGRIRASSGRYPIYELTPDAPEYRSPNPSPSPEGDLDSDSDLGDESQARESESESATPPFRGVAAELDSDSRADFAKRATRGRPKKPGKKPKRRRPARRRRSPPGPNGPAVDGADEEAGDG